MANSCADILSKCDAGLWIPLIALTCCITIPFIVFGSLSASDYVNNRNTRQLYTSTTCLLLNYSKFERPYSAYGCSPHKCFDETFTVSYPISNDTSIRSVFASVNEKEHLQTQIGNNYSCFYQTKNITSVLWDLPNLSDGLIEFFPFFGVAGWLLILLVMALYYTITN